MKTFRNLGSILLGLWLILFGLLAQHFVHIGFRRSHDVLALLAIVVGVVVLVRRQ